MKKILAIVLGLLLVVSANNAHAEVQCESVNQLPEILIELQDFTAKISTMDKASFDTALSQISSKTQTIITTAAGCNSYGDRMIGQLVSAIEVISSNAEFYRSTKA